MNFRRKVLILLLTPILLLTKETGMAQPINTSTAQWIDPEAQYQFSPSSEEKLATGNQLLQLITRRALELSPTDFKITQGRRSTKQQQQAQASGASKVSKSKHTYPSSLAFDIAYLDDKGNTVTDWAGLKKYMPGVADAFRRAAEEMGVNLRWGGSWKNLRGTTDDPLNMYSSYVTNQRQLMMNELQKQGIDTSTKSPLEWEVEVNKKGDKNKKGYDPKYRGAYSKRPLHDTGHFELSPNDLSTHNWVVG